MLRTKPGAVITVRDVKIKTGVVKRISKELNAYGQEEIKQQQRIDKLIADGKDEHDVWKQQEVLAETVDIIPDCRQRLAMAQKQLHDLLSKVVAEEGDEDVLAAKALLEQLAVTA